MEQPCWKSKKREQKYRLLTFCWIHLCTPIYQSHTQISMVTQRGQLMSIIWCSNLTGARYRYSKPSWQKIMGDWMNALFVFRNLFPRSLFCARKLTQRRSCLPKFCSLICRLPDSSFFSFKNDFKLRLFVGIQTMSNASGENSSLLDNLRKSVKEQVRINTSCCWNNKFMPLAWTFLK